MYRLCKNFQGEWPLTQISRAPHYLTLNISEKIRDRHMATWDSNRKWYVACWTVPLPMTLIDLQGYLSYFSLWVWPTFFILFYLSPGNLMKDDIADNVEWPFKVISSTVNSFCTSNTAYIMYEVDYNGRTTWAIISSHIQLEPGRTVMWCWVRPVSDILSFLVSALATILCICVFNWTAMLW